MKYKAEEIKNASPEELIRAFSPWLHFMANRYKGYLTRSGVLDEEDLYWSGAEALLKAQETWDPQLSGFLNHSFYGVRHAMQRALTFGKKDMEPPQTYLDAPLSEDGETLLDLIESDEKRPEEYAEEEDLKAQVQAALDRLEDPVAESILKKRYYDEKTVKEVGADMEMDPNDVQNYTNRALRRLRQDRRLASVTSFMRRVGLNEFRATRTSEVEWAVLAKERANNQLYGGIRKQLGRF